MGKRKSGRMKSRKGETMGREPLGVRKLISIRSREIVKGRTDLKHVVYENLQISHKFCQILHFYRFLYVALNLRT